MIVMIKKRTVILDTNVLLHDPESPRRFGSDQVIIPIQVIEEVDRFKKDPGEKGRNARRVSRLLDSFRAKGNLADGVSMSHGNGSTLKVAFCRKETTDRLPPELKGDSGDNKILAVALEEQNKRMLGDESEVVLISKDTNLRIKADAVGLKAESYTNDLIDVKDLYSGFRAINVNHEVIDNLNSAGSLLLDSNPKLLEAKLRANEGVVFNSEGQKGHTYLGRYHAETKSIRGLEWLKRARLGRIKSKNLEQSFALDLLLDPNVQLVSLVGKAGTGKTLLALAVGLHLVADENLYDKLLVTRPPISLGKELGYLPGSLEEKLAPWMKPIIDNLNYLTGSGIDKQGERSKKHVRNNSTHSWEDLKGMGLIEVEAINYIRGRSIAHQYILVDEAQNLTPLEVKTIVTRAGEGTKLVFTGDPNQIDNPYVDSDSNGLTWLAEKLKGQNIVGHITLSKGERSPLAELAANML